MDSIEWGAWLDERRMAGRNIEFLIGGPEGLPSALVEGADERISLGRMTLAHQLARVVLLEQLFRAGKISAGERYHL
jgi:23S rRNA (pseudouridine1915-N3)-methyltransferase